MRLLAVRLDPESWPAQRPDYQIVTPIQLRGSVRCVHGTTPKHSMAESAQNELAHKDPLYRCVILASFFRTHKWITYKVFVTGVPVNIHRNLARSWATTLLARVALKYNTRWVWSPDTYSWMTHRFRTNWASSSTTRYHFIRARIPLKRQHEVDKWIRYRSVITHARPDILLHLQVQRKGL